MPQGLHDALWSRRLNSRVLLDHCYFAGVPVAEVFVALASPLVPVPPSFLWLHTLAATIVVDSSHNLVYSDVVMGKQ